MKISLYYRLTKPGIIYGNAITAVAGFLLAAMGHINIGNFAAMLSGLSLIIASACVFNNYFDRDLDRNMARTKKRALAAGTISVAAAISYGCLLLLLGVALLGFYTNILALAIALAGFAVYVGLYTFSKRHTVHGTVIGSLSGAVPPVVGYTSVTGHLDFAALFLFLTLVFWQMPHFYSIAIYRASEYKKAGIPVLPLVKGIKNTRLQILAYLIGFIIAGCLLTIYGYAGYIYLIGLLIVGILWLRLYIKGYRLADSHHWARQMFGFSLLAILVWSILISLTYWLP